MFGITKLYRKSFIAISFLVTGFSILAIADAGPVDADGPAAPEPAPTVPEPAPVNAPADDSSSSSSSTDTGAYH